MPQRQAALRDPHSHVVQSELYKCKEVSQVVATQSKIEAVATTERTHLSDEECEAIRAELERLVKEKEVATGRSGKRAVGMDLGWPRENASQAIQAALDPDKRPGYLVAERLYRYLDVSREAFLAARGLGPKKRISTEVVATVLDEENWSAIGLNDADAKNLVETIKEALASRPAPAPASPRVESASSARKERR